MSRLEFHADGLLDRARSGQLTPEESARLAAHCAGCAACRMEFLWVVDLAPRAAPTAEDRARADQAVEALLGAAPRVERPTRGRSRFGSWVAAAAIGVGLLVASAAAALYTEVRALREWVMEASTRVGLPPPAPERVERKRKRAAARTPVVAPAIAPVPVPAAPAEAAPPEPPPTEAPVPESARAIAPVAKLPEERPTRVVAPTVDTLLARANAARAEGRYADAAAGYAELARLHPGSRGELTARVSNGLLLLHHLGQPDAARDAFARYLAALPSGPLAEEAQVGLAVSLERLGRTREERIAWQELLERHPGSLHAARARERLERLPGP
jgi:TolA-binding protein